MRISSRKVEEITVKTSAQVDPVDRALHSLQNSRRISKKSHNYSRIVLMCSGLHKCKILADPDKEDGHLLPGGHNDIPYIQSGRTISARSSLLVIFQMIQKT